MTVWCILQGLPATGCPRVPALPSGSSPPRDAGEQERVAQSHPVPGPSQTRLREQMLHVRSNIFIICTPNPPLFEQTGHPFQNLRHSMSKQPFKHKPGTTIFEYEKKKCTTCLQWTTQMVRGKFLIRGRSISAGRPSFHIFPASLASTWAAVIKITLYATQREVFFVHRHGCSHICLLLEPEPPCCVCINSCRQVRKPSAKSCEGDPSGFAGVIEKEVQCCGMLSGLCWTKWQVNPAVNRWTRCALTKSWFHRTLSGSDLCGFI